ncbi:putative Mediator of RNA polymerase II transcription subunit 19 [Diplocarpon rosae]|nr:putative Mediator of RNA polymerase II transcription subunit 19 [Diplocarpon rosae]
MTSNLPRTPETPSQTSPNHSSLPSKPVNSPAGPHSILTPARSVNGSMSSATVEIPSEGFLQEDSCHKRKRDVEDHGDQEMKKLHVEEPEIQKVTIEDISEDVGALYLFCKKPHQPRLPPLTTDLFERYGLTSIAKAVTRTNPDGSKAVKLRKTYKNHIKTHGLAGSFDAVKKEVNGPGTLMDMLKTPDDAWAAQFVTGKEIEKGIPASMLEKGHSTFVMARGAIPKDEFNSAVLGEVSVDLVKTVQSGNRTPRPQSTVTRPAQATSKAEIRRPARNINKRSYTDDSFEGYAEGQGVEDEVQDEQDTEYTTAEGDDRGIRKRVKKSSQAHTGVGNHQGGAVRQGGYGPGMVGA